MSRPHHWILIAAFAALLLAVLSTVHMLHWLRHVVFWLALVFAVFLVIGITRSGFWVQVIQNHFGAILLSATIVTITVTLTVTNHHFINIHCCCDCPKGDDSPPRPPVTTTVPPPTQLSWWPAHGTASDRCIDLVPPGTSPLGQAAVGNRCSRQGQRCFAGSGQGSINPPVIECRPASGVAGRWQQSSLNAPLGLPVCPGHAQVGPQSPAGLDCYSGGSSCRDYTGTEFTCM